jgi:hypothetical protein
MTLPLTETRVLIALAILSQDNEMIDIFSLSTQADLSIFATLRAVAALHVEGLVDQRRLRLTLMGLARAVPLCPELRATANLRRLPFVHLAVA